MDEWAPGHITTVQDVRRLSDHSECPSRHMLLMHGIDCRSQGFTDRKDGSAVIESLTPPPDCYQRKGYSLWDRRREAIPSGLGVN